MKFHFSGQRLWAIIVKEFTQMKRDRYTFAFIVITPFIQLILFGYAIDVNPKHLPTVIVAADNGIFTRQVITFLQNSEYFDILKGNYSQTTADELLRTEKAQFVVYIPQDFSKRLVHGDHPEILVEADATDPTATGSAIAAFQNLNQEITQNLPGSLSYLKPAEPAINVVVQAKYNPERITQYNIVPGLLGVLLSMTLVVITALAITREKERGTMEGLLVMPVQPIEIMVGKIVPYIFVGYIQIGLILFFAYLLFKIPINGSLLLLFIASLPFIAANLAVGITFSTLAQNQLQAMQATFFFLLPTMLLSGFLFPFYGMSYWAQVIGDILPLTHFNTIVRGILLKGNGMSEILRSVLAITLFFIAMLVVAVKRFHKTLD